MPVSLAASASAGSAPAHETNVAVVYGPRAGHTRIPSRPIMKVDIRAAELLGRELHGMFMGRQEVTMREHHSVPRRSLVNALTACCELFKAAIYLRGRRQ